MLEQGKTFRAAGMGCMYFACEKDMNLGGGVRAEYCGVNVSVPPSQSPSLQWDDVWR